MISTVRKLPISVRTLICASNQINSFSKAVQELVFNALDADATSIAVRIHINDGSIQVVDNGCGIPKADFKYIGQNYMTSKLVDISTLKSAPNKYGFQGQSLANLAQISETMKVISRFYECETTCVKTFEKGKAKLITKGSPRPSKGTTIEIKDFLFNLNIQKKSVDSINELQNIKTFLEHLSLVHSSISLSLRDDSKNEIVYKIHKNRDIYQTLFTLYEIDKSNVQELQVEKNQYKVKAYVGRHDVEIRKQLIFLNGKCINDASLLHKKVNGNFKKHLRGIKKKINKNMMKNNNDEETHLFGNNIPFYFIFLTCPYMDYEFTNRVLEFKDWGQVNTILEKLVKFYIGDTQIQAIRKKQIRNINNKKNTESTRKHIENIMQKILGTRNKKPAISQMQNGIKGKLIKRKSKNKKRISKILNSVKAKSRELISTHNLGEKELIEEQSPKDDSALRIQPQRYAANINIKSSSHLSNVPIGNAQNISVTKQENAKVKNKLPKRLWRNNQVRSFAKRNDKPHLKKIYLNDKFALETESVKQRCKLLAENTEKLMKYNKINHPDVFINENVQYTCSNFVNGNKNIAVRAKVNEIVIHEYIPLPPKTDVGKEIGNDSQFKSNYDLLRTVLSTQKERSLQESGRKPAQDNLVPSTTESDNYTKRNNTKLNNALFGAVSFDKNYVPRELNNQSFNELATPNSNTSLCIRESKDIYFHKNLEPYNNHKPSDAQDLHRSNSVDTPECNLSFIRGLSSKYRSQTDIPGSNIEPYLISRTSSDTSPFQAVTFQSHNYGRTYQSSRDVEPINLYKKPKNFITTQSIENFLKFPKDNRSKTSNVGFISTLVQTKNQKRKWNKSNKLLNVINNTVKEIRESYTIEFTESNEYENPFINGLGNSQEIMNYTPTRTHEEDLEEATPTSCILNKNHTPTNPRTWYMHSKNTDEHLDLKHESLNQNTYAISDSYKCSKISLNTPSLNINETYSIEKSEKSCFNRADAIENLNNNNENISFVFVSKSQENDSDMQIMDPINVCETILNDQLSTDKEREFSISFNCKPNSHNISNEIDDDMVPNEMNDTMDIYFTYNPTCGKNILTKSPNQKEVSETSHHFTIPNNNVPIRQSPMLTQNDSPILEAQLVEKMPLDEINILKKNKDTATVSKALNEQSDMEAYSIRNRMCFVPKGMSPIFQKYQTKSIYDFDPNEDYYTDKIYEDFLKKVQNDADVFKPGISDTRELTKDISKVNRQENCDASLKFDGQCIKNAKVLDQVDYKFIAAIMRSKSHTADFREFIVLFDQHAVHERIRLENNLADYLMESQWKSVTIDEMSLKMSRDDILYLHNYGDKFTQFGLQWNIINQNEMSINAIPEAILGKNPRQVEKIIKAVKNLITEEIQIIQMQRGCVSIYPKSIMELVFSEACRYAIKFGDYLPKSRCMKLLNELSACKTPFQCAHGRPSMAVIMNIEDNQADYKINFKMVQQFKKFNLDKLQ